MPYKNPEKQREAMRRVHQRERLKLQWLKNRVGYLEMELERLQK